MKNLILILAVLFIFLRNAYTNDGVVVLNAYNINDDGTNLYVHSSVVYRTFESCVNMIDATELHHRRKSDTEDIQINRVKNSLDGRLEVYYKYRKKPVRYMYKCETVMFYNY